MFNRITPIVKNLLIINFLCFAACWVFEQRGIYLNNAFGLHVWRESSFHFWQFLTYMFMHANFSHLFFNMFALWVFGVSLEGLWGSKRFLIYYLLTGIGAGFTQEMVWMLMGQPYGVTIGASGAIFGILLAFAWLFPETRMFVFPIPIPIRARVLVIIYAVIELFAGMAPSSSGVAHFAHLGGLIFGLLLILYWKKKGVQNMEAGYFDTTLWKRTWETIVNKWNNFVNRYKSESSNNPHSGFHYQEPTRETTDDSAETKEQSTKQNDEEINRILDKIKLSGYDSLTEEERKKLFKR